MAVTRRDAEWDSWWRKQVTVRAHTPEGRIRAAIVVWGREHASFSVSSRVLGDMKEQVSKHVSSPVVDRVYNRLRSGNSIKLTIFIPASSGRPNVKRS